MDDKTFDALKKQMEAAGFDYDLDKVRHHLKGKEISLADYRNFGNDKLTRYWQMSLHEDNQYRVDKVTASLKKEIEIPKTTIHNIDLEELDKKFKAIDWHDPKTYESLNNTGSPEFKAMYDLARLYYFDPESRDMHNKFAFKHLADTPAEGLVMDINEVKWEFARKVESNPNSDPAFSANEMRNLLDDRYVNKSVVEDGGSEDKWFKVDLASKDRDGFSKIEPAAVSRDFKIEQAMQKAGIKEYQDIPAETIHQMKQGDIVTLTLQNNNLEGKRAFYLDPEKAVLRVNHRESVRRGFLDEMPQEISKKKESKDIVPEREIHQSKEIKKSNPDLDDDQDQNRNKGRRR